MHHCDGHGHFMKIDHLEDVQKKSLWDVYQTTFFEGQLNGNEFSSC